MANALSNAPTTSIFAGIYAILYALLSMRVALHRLFINTRAGKDAFLDRTPEEQAAVSEEQAANLHTWVRIHGNFQEYIPFCVVLSLLLELNDAPRAAIYVPNLALLFARLAHIVGLTGWLSGGNRANPWRMVGFGLTITFVAYVGIYVLIRGAKEY